MGILGALSGPHPWVRLLCLYTTALPRLLGKLPKSKLPASSGGEGGTVSKAAQRFSGSAFEVLGEAHPEITLAKELQSHKTHFSCSFSS